MNAEQYISSVPTPIPSQSAPPIPNPPSVKKTSKILFIIPILVFIGIIIFGIGKLLNTNSSTPVNSNQTTDMEKVPIISPTNIPIVTSTELDTSNWKTFTSSRFFSVKYPSDIFEKRDIIEDALYIMHRTLLPNIYDYGINIIAYDNQYNSTLDEYLQEPMTKKIYGDLKKELITVDGIKGYKFIHETPPEYDKKVFYVDYLIQKRNFIYEISLQASKKEYIEKNINLFEKIISTFQFVTPQISEIPNYLICCESEYTCLDKSKVTMYLMNAVDNLPLLKKGGSCSAVLVKDHFDIYDYKDKNCNARWNPQDGCVNTKL
jgi:hypothetical protein